MEGGALTDRLGYTNPKVQRLRRLLGRRSARQEHRAFVVEGPMLVAEAVAAGWKVEAQFVAPGTVPASGAGDVVHQLAPGVAERMADTDTPTGLFGLIVAPTPDPDALAKADFVVVADRVADPGNLGTILRSAEAAGVDAVVVTPGTVDAFNPKVVRASAGALFHVPVVEADLATVRQAGLRMIGTSSHRGTAHTLVDWSGRVAIVAGNEAHGLDDDAPVDEWMCILHHGRAESLNVAMAVTVVCFEAARHR
jgi:RNA methyltransferase, TrmH family